MTAERWVEVRALLNATLALPADERNAFLARAASDPEVIAEVRALMVFDRQSSLIFSIEDWQQRMARSEHDANLSGTVIGSYRLIDELGRGGMGTVYLAERADGAYLQRVAIKVLQENIFTPALADRFRQERQILARLSHPGVARLLDGGVMPDGRPYLVLEYVEGLPIDRFCDERQLNVEARLRLFLQVAEVVQSAHQQLVLHLDLKPANILVTPEGDPRLLDFGIARIVSEAETASDRSETTLRLLTPRYASPEQASGAPLGVASDVFSLATLLYRLLTGKLPYPLEDASPLDAAQMLRDTPPMTPSQAAPDERKAGLRGDLDTILLQALRKEPERRYPTIAAFADDVLRHLQSQPVLAHADSLGYRAGKFWQRNRVTVIAASAATIILVVSVAAVVQSAIVARRQRAVAEQRLRDMRGLAHSYVFDLDPKLENIPGTVNVRHFVLQNAQKYLEAMSKEFAADDDLARETAQGYVQISEVQQTFGVPSLSDWSGAMKSLDKALLIERHLVDKHPADLKERNLLVVQMRHVGTLTASRGEILDADKMMRDTWTTGQPLINTQPSSRDLIQMPVVAWIIAWLHCGNGDMWNLADPVEASRWLDRAKELMERYQKEHPEAVNNNLTIGTLERIAITRADILMQLNQAAAARPYYEEALRLTTTSHQSTIEDEMRRQIRAYYAGYLLAIGDPHGADALAPLLMPPAFHEAGSDRLPTSDEADELTLLARIDLENGRIAQGRARMERGVKTLQELHKSIPYDGDVETELAWDSFRLAGEKALDPNTRTRLYRIAIGVADDYAANHPHVLSPLMLHAQCELGLAGIAHDQHARDQEQEHLQSAIQKLSAVLAEHPVQPQASSLLARAKILATS